MLGPDFTVFGFRAPGSEPGESIDYYSVEEYATMFADLLVAKQPAGPIHLMGYCAGGTIIVEMARQLKTEPRYGREVALLAMIDSPDPEQSLVFPDNATFLEKDFSQSFGISVSREEILAFAGDDNYDAQLGFVVEKGKAQGIFPRNQNMEFFQRFIGMEATTRDSITAYKPSMYFRGRNSISGLVAEEVVFFKAEVTEAMAWSPNPESWKPYLENISVSQCRGTHSTMIKDPLFCQFLADQIRPHVAHLLGCGQTP